MWIGVKLKLRGKRRRKRLLQSRKKHRVRRQLSEVPVPTSTLSVQEALKSVKTVDSAKVRNNTIDTTSTALNQKSIKIDEPELNNSEKERRRKRKKYKKTCQASKIGTTVCYPMSLLNFNKISLDVLNNKSVEKLSHENVSSNLDLYV